MRRALSILAGCLLLASACADEWDMKVDPNKVSDLANKRFDIQNADGFNAVAPGFDKSFSPAVNGDWTNKMAQIGGRDIYVPALDLGKMYPVPENTLFKGTSDFSGKTSDLASKTSTLPTDAHFENFNHLVDDKYYQGREADLIRQAMDQLSVMKLKKGDALSQQMTASMPNDGHKIDVAPEITVEDVKSILNKDVGPQPSSSGGGTVLPATSAAPAAIPSATGAAMGPR